ncbi:MAG: hypothetical protein JXQ90_14285 [Cyclobacteriaceae bacterium]
MSQRYEWFHFSEMDFDELSSLRVQYHQAIQNVAAVGRTFLAKSEDDQNAVLSWVPGLWRMAGKWVKANKTFRSSFSLDDCKVYLVDEKVNTIGSFDLAGQTYTQVMIWLEEQIGTLLLTHSELSMNLPYELSDEVFQKGEKFDKFDLQLSHDFGGLYHSPWIIFSELKNKYESSSDIRIWPHHFDIAMTITLKETGEEATNTTLTLGMFPGDEHNVEPYFYVASWPHIQSEPKQKIVAGTKWVSDDWTGTVLPLSTLWQETNQKSYLMSYFQGSINAMSAALIQ